ncbi:MAG: hypothetical protein DHS20C18_44990 [Saprospiraceae bacterium]|nr:MAG: hypothetical protein DHS20C18_44990 [Saprospiraceae bacterium]
MLNMDAVYNRPFLTVEKMPVALGGYLEANTLYQSEAGVSEGLSFQARRLTIFMSASINKRIKFLSEMEFEDGTKEIGIEFAALDVSFHPALNFRGGIIMNPIGAFNQNHDGPKWEFVERPDVAVNLLPATWSNAGFGVYGKTYKGDWILGYEAYLTNGFNNNIIDNEASKTFLPAAKENERRFEESSNGQPLLTGKVSIKNRKIGEIGLSYMGGVYNKFEEDGLTLDEKRRVDVVAIDWNTTMQKTGTYIVGELVYTWVDVPSTYTQQFGSKQKGVFIDVVQPILKKSIFDWDNATLNLAARFDYVDWNLGTFKETNADIGDVLWAITPAISFRPSSQTVFRLNYRYQWQKDLLNNAPAKSASWLFGFSSYF